MMDLRFSCFRFGKQHHQRSYAQVVTTAIHADTVGDVDAQIQPDHLQIRVQTVCPRGLI